MAGRRPLTTQEERMLIKVLRRTNARERALVTTELFSGFRSYEIRNLTVGHIWRNGQVTTKLGVQPRHRKGGYGSTHWIPIGCEMQRALEKLMKERIEKNLLTKPSDPLFPSRKRGPNGQYHPMGKKQVYRLVMKIFRRAKIENDGRLGTHSLRKTFAAKVYKLSGNDLMVTRDALGHSSCSVTERYLESDREKVEDVILQGDWTRKPRKKAA